LIPPNWKAALINSASLAKLCVHNSTGISPTKEAPYSLLAQMLHHHCRTKNTKKEKDIEKGYNLHLNCSIVEGLVSM